MIREMITYYSFRCDICHKKLKDGVSFTSAQKRDDAMVMHQKKHPGMNNNLRMWKETPQNV